MTEQIRAPAINASYLPQQIGMSAATSVHVCVEGVPFQYQLTDDDLMKVFSRYGCVSNITVLDEGGSAIVQFTLPSDAARATSVLDGKVLNGVHGALRVTLFPAVPSGRIVESGVPNIYSDHTEDISTRLAKKYTCRFEIPADMDPDFCVSKRIIGQKGSNMKKIVSSLPCADAAKLRLRGRGSGFLEGPMKQESNESLHLCVSCRDGDSYSIVIREVTALMEEVYAQYEAWCHERGFHHPLPKIVPRNHPDHHHTIQPPSVQYPRSLYPPSWGSMAPSGIPDWKHQVSVNVNTKGMMFGGYRSEYGQTPSPQSMSTHPGVSAANTPPDVPSPSSNGFNRRCPLDVATIERIIEERNEARRICNFKEADRLRDMLKSYGIGLMDEPGARGRGTEVTTWRFAATNTTGTVTQMAAVPQQEFYRK